ncbi:hypothetical protein NEFER03_1888 [Nematocida sp. LUAm3]|nr:hypothetical protein NEFER03_1888 [Nematocida sp. LUAm3]KAI5173961.1 hypothetical protein NEFER02_0428 [Nematocida sp. LUAm2]KAI5177294.1 hypothetical protein NEFER01_0569 [Nematocida sp. LUAm1]
MQCRRISTLAVSVGFTLKEDTHKRNPYITQLICQLPKKETRLGDIFRMHHEEHTYYGVLSDDGDISWFAASGSISYIASYPLQATKQETNAFFFLHPEKKFFLKRPHDTQSANGAQSTNDSVDNLCIKDSAIICSTEHIYIEGSNSILVYGKNGGYLWEIEKGTDKISKMDLSACEKHLFIGYEKAGVHMYAIKEKKWIYKRKGVPGNIQIFGDVHAYSVFLCFSEKSVFLLRAENGSVILELTFPEEVTCASMDPLQNRLICGSNSGTIYHTRLDGGTPEFQTSKVSSAPTVSLCFSLNGSIIYAETKGSLLSVAIRDGQVLHSILTGAVRTFFTRTTNSNLHLN